MRKKLKGKVSKRVPNGAYRHGAKMGALCCKFLSFLSFFLSVGRSVRRTTHQQVNRFFCYFRLQLLLPLRRLNASCAQLALRRRLQLSKRSWEGGGRRDAKVSSSEHADPEGGQLVGRSSRRVTFVREVFFLF